MREFVLLLRPNKKIPVFRVTPPYLNSLVKPRIFFRFSGKNRILGILKGKMPFKMHKIIFFLLTIRSVFLHRRNDHCSKGITLAMSMPNKIEEQWQLCKLIGFILGRHLSYHKLLVEIGALLINTK